jgi:hypothetical protein
MFVDWMKDAIQKWVQLLHFAVAKPRQVEQVCDRT